MICYRGRSYCADQDQCGTPDSECWRRLTPEECEHTVEIELPIAWMSFRKTCGKFVENEKK